MQQKLEKEGSMDVPNTVVFAPNSLSELFAAKKNFPNAVYWAGGTDLASGQGARLLKLPQTLINIGNIEELKTISRTERYLDLGATVNLSRMLKLEKQLPPLLFSAILTISSPQIRNMATLGGNILACPGHADLLGPLTALEALVELRTAISSRWISLSRLSFKKEEIIQPGELLCRIRIPLESWNYQLYRKIVPLEKTNQSPLAFTILAKTAKGFVEDVRIVLSLSQKSLRNQVLESQLIGKSIPLSRKALQLWLEAWENYLSSFEDLTRYQIHQLLPLLKASAMSLADS